MEIQKECTELVETCGDSDVWALGAADVIVVCVWMSFEFGGT